MFDVGASELLMIVIVAVVVIGPKDLPLAMRTAGRWIGKMRKISGHFRSGLDAMVREAELEDMERKWREQNEAIMKASPTLPILAEPSVEDMQAPTSSPAAVTETVAKPVSETTHDKPADETHRPSELHLPPQA